MLCGLSLRCDVWTLLEPVSCVISDLETECMDSGLEIVMEFTCLLCTLHGMLQIWNVK